MDWQVEDKSEATADNGCIGHTASDWTVERCHSARSRRAGCAMAIDFVPTAAVGCREYWRES